MSDVREEIENLLAVGTFSRARLSMILKEISAEAEKEKRPKRSHVPSSPCIQYIEIKRNYTCLHCGARETTTVKLRRGEDVIAITQGGAKIIVAESPAEIECVCKGCRDCRKFISGMSREDLENRYIELLENMPLEMYKKVIGRKQ